MTNSSSRYVVGIDIGTTYTAAAIHTLGDSAPVGASGRWHMAELGTRSTTMPSLVLSRPDGTILVGEAAERRSLIEPDRVAREFKRRLGDSVPLLLGGTPYSAEQLTARVLRHALDHITEVEGGAPAALALTHPANWGTFKIDVLRAAVDLAGENAKRVTFISEPEAAALAYAAHDRPPPGARMAVYDLGGGTFDVAILEDHGDRYALVGEPGGVERLGGIDFDEALFRHVLTMIEGLDAIDTTEPSIVTDLVALRQSCVAAKEALSVETDTAVAVRVGPIRSEIRVVRSEFEALIRPTLDYTTDALRRTLHDAGLNPADLHAVLLVGGSSRIPLVSQLVSATLGRPVALDIHPKHAVALGAALVAAGTAPADVPRADLPLVVIGSAGEDPGDPYAPAASAPPDPPPPPPPQQHPQQHPQHPRQQPDQEPRQEPVEVPQLSAGAPTTGADRPFSPGPDLARMPPPHAPSTVPPEMPVTKRIGLPPSPGVRFVPSETRSGRGRSRTLAAIATGAFLGVVALVGLIVLQSRDRDDGDDLTTATTAATDATASSASTATTAERATVDAANGEVRRFLESIAASDNRLISLGVTPRGVEVCQEFLGEVAQRYGDPPTTSPAIPPQLAPVLDAADPAYTPFVRPIIDLAIRRYQACVNRDGDTYLVLQAEENTLREQLDVATSPSVTASG